MTYYGPWHEPVVQTVTITDGAVAGGIPIGNSSAASYAHSVGTNQFQALNGFSVTFVTANHPTVGHSWDGSTAVLDIAEPFLSFDPVALNPYLIGTVPPNASVDIDETAPHLGNSAVTGDTAEVYLTPLSYSGPDTGDVFTAGVAGAGGSWPEPGVNTDAIWATWNYGDTSPVRINDQAMTPAGFLYSVSAFVWDKYSIHGAGGSPLVAGQDAFSAVAISLVVEVQSPRWRFAYEVPPRLRQYPRDDFLGGAPRQDRSSRSVQASQRQGWVGAYR